MNLEPLIILLAEDDPDDRDLAIEALAESGTNHQLQTVADGEELLEYLRREKRYAPPAYAPHPALVLLDMNMPRMNGREALTIMKADPALRRIPVVVLSTSRSAGDVVSSYDLGANAYIGKPVTFPELVNVLGTLGAHWLKTVVLAPH
ncbi:MAG: response regulator [bacterium]